MASQHLSLLEGLPNSEMLQALADQELGMPRLSEMLNSLDDEDNHYTVFLPQGVSCLPPPGVPVEAYLSKLIGAHSVRGAYTIESLAKGPASLKTLDGSTALSVSNGLINGQKMQSQHQFANGNIVVVGAPLIALNGGLIGATSQKAPIIEDIIAVPTVNCSHCGDPSQGHLADGFLYCSEEHAQLGPRDEHIDEQASWTMLTDPTTGSKTLAVSGPFRRRRWRRRRGWPWWYNGGYYDYYPPYYPAAAVTVPGLTLGIGEKVDCHMDGKHHKKRKDKASKQLMGEVFGLEVHDEDMDVGVSLRRNKAGKLRLSRRKKSAAEEAAKQRQRDARAERRATRSEKRLARQRRRKARAERREDRETGRRDQQRRELSSSSESESDEEMPPPPPPVRSIRELLATKNQNPLDLTNLKAGLEFESGADQLFYTLAVQAVKEISSK